MIEIDEGGFYVLDGFVGERQILMIGSGEVALYRSLNKGVNFYPMTDEAGGTIIYGAYDEEESLLNSTITNNCQSVKFAIKCTEGSVKLEVVKNG
jgi:hypothetical protein